MADALEEFATKEPASGTIRDRQLDAAVDGSIVHDLHLEEEDPGLEASEEEAAEVEDDYEGAAESSTGSSEVSGRAMNNTSGDEQHEVNTKFVCYRTTLVCANTKLVYFNLQEPYEGKFRVDVDDGEQPWAADQDQPIFEEARKYTVYLSLTADATDFAKWVNKSFTPVTSKILNLDCTLRSRMSNIQLHAVLPESIRDYNSLLRPVIIQLNRYRPRGGRPIQIHHPRTGRPMHLYVHLAYTVNDMRGVPGCTGGSHPPCTEGSCVVCKVRGVYRHHRTILPASVRLVPMNSELRRIWELEFDRDPTLKSYANMAKPARRTKEEALASGGRVMRNEANKKDEAFANVSVLSEVLNYHDVTKHSKTDLAHCLANALKLLLGQVTNTAGGKAKFADKYRQLEMRLMRFAYLNEKTEGRNTRNHKYYLVLKYTNLVVSVVDIDIV